MDEHLIGYLSDVDAHITGSLSQGESISGAVSAFDLYTGDYAVTPLAREAVVLPTHNKLMVSDITVLEVPYFETSNESGHTVYIASEV